MSDSPEGAEPERSDRAEGRSRRAVPYTFTTVVARSWRLYKETAGPLIRLFLVAGAIVALGQSLLLLDVSDDTENTINYAVFVILPAVVYSVAFAIATYILKQEEDEDPVYATTAYRELKPQMRNLLSLGLVSSVLTALNVLMLGPLLLQLFYGPPLLVQVAVLYNEPLQEAWPRTKDLMRGDWGRALLYLMSIVLGISVVVFAAFSTVAAAADPLSDTAIQAIGIALRVGLTAVTLPYLAGFGYVIYREQTQAREND